MPESFSAAKLAVLPKVKTTDIVVQELESEMLVYDLENDKAHHLNETVAFVWKCCNGKTSTKEIASLVAKRLDTKIDQDFVMLALDELQKANLLGTESESDDIDLTRRKVLFKYAPIAAAFPVVMSLVAPASAQMGSCIAPGAPCVGGGPDCCSLRICEVGTCDPPP